MGGADDERVLVLTPTGRDAEMVRERIVADGMACEVCTDVPTLVAGIAAGAGAAVIAQEALGPAGAEELLAALQHQEPWSDIPILFLAETRPNNPPLAVSGYFERVNVTLLQRPLAIPFFLSSVRSAIRARRRQYEMRDLHRALERAVQLSDMFVSILGHDLRSPIGAIRMAADIIVRISTDPRALRPAGRILTSTDRVTRMIEQLLDFARARQGRGIPLQLGFMNLGELCRQAVQELEDANPQASLVIHEAGDLAGLWDADRLVQVVTNLAGNAVQHGTRGEPITIELDGAAASIVRLRIHSAGAIPAEALPTLFEAFKQPSKASRSGLGLGLFIAREIARAHGGELTAQSADHHTTFEVTLPREARPVDTGALAIT